MMEEHIKLVMEVVTSKEVFSEKILEPWKQAGEIFKFRGGKHLDETNFRWHTTDEIDFEMMEKRSVKERCENRLHKRISTSF